jgi:hypothetical protein
LSSEQRYRRLCARCIAGVRIEGAKKSWETNDGVDSKMKYIEWLLGEGKVAGHR